MKNYPHVKHSSYQVTLQKPLEGNYLVQIQRFCYHTFKIQYSITLLVYC
jgi:hypothetical protein